MNIKNLSLLKLLAAVFASVTLLMACSNNDLIDQTPTPISRFIAQYFPGYNVGQYEHNSTGYHLRLKNGPGMNFSDAYVWESIDGYGMPLPQVFLFDQTPPKLYNYLQETSSLNSVFSIARDSQTYSLTLLDTNLVYNISTEQITSPTTTTN